MSTTSEDDDPDYEPGEDAKMALIALLTTTLQKADDSSDSECEEDDPPFVAKCREKMKLLQGHMGTHTAAWPAGNWENNVRNPVGERMGCPGHCGQTSF